MPLDSQRPVAQAKRPPENNPNKPNHTNWMLDALPAAEYEQLKPHLRPVELTIGHGIHEYDEVPEYTYFVTQGMVSLVLSSDEGIEVEVGLIGKEGVAGIGAALGHALPRYRAMVQVPGCALRVRSTVLAEHFKHSNALQLLVLRHMQLLHGQSVQIALCNRLHTVEERLARWLLMVYDRVESDDLSLTQEFLAMMLGSRRSGVTVAAGTLREAGLIDYSRGNIKLRDLEGLRDASCECYPIVQRQLSQFLDSQPRF
jgi:CRP-like cAMP-binding protein